MFIREIKSKGKTYLNIIETYRQEGKVKHRSIASFGCLDSPSSIEQIRRLAFSLLKYCNDNKNILDISHIEEKARKNWGAVCVFKKLWDTFELPVILREVIRGRKVKFDFFSAVFLMILDRLVEPRSKLRSYLEQQRYYQVKTNGLQHLYRALDILCDGKEEIEKNLFEKNKSLFNMRVDVVLYDVTTLYFESVRRDGLREFGFSKDCKVREVQILLGLLVDLEGRPIGFDIFAGNSFEGHTIKEVISRLKNRFEINKVIFIGDRAMLSKENIKIISDYGYEYIIGSRLKNKGEDIKEEILNPEGYISISMAEDEFRYKRLKVGDNYLLCSWSSKRAKKDCEDRQRLISKAETLIEARGISKVISKKGALRYIKTEGIKDISYGIDEERILEDAKLDGYYAIETNCKYLTDETLLNYYHQLWRVEDSFRLFKSHLETRPIFHWTPKRIKGHLVLCFIAFLLERTLEIKLKGENIKYSPEKIRRALDSLEFSEIDVNGEIFYLRSAIEGLSKDILKALGIKPPPKIATPEQFIKV